MHRSSSTTPQPERVTVLLAAVALGDHRAFDQLYTEMAERVLYFVQRRLRDRAQSEEVAQEVFLEVWQQAPRFDPSKGVAATWILTMARRRAIDRVRAAQSSRNRDQLVADRDRAVPHDEVIEAVESREMSDIVRSALEGISALQREAVTLAYLHGYTIAETARLVGASESAVKTRVRDGVRAMRGSVERLDAEDAA